MDGQYGASPPRLAAWLDWPAERVARWVSAQQPLVMGWPFNGTRRWYALHRHKSPTAGDYVTTTIRCQAEQHRLVFDHGVRVIVAPHFGAELLERGQAYTRAVLGDGLLKLGEDSINQEMFEAGLRIRFYGDYKEILDTPTYRPMLDACTRLSAATASGDGPLLLIGLFADAPFPRIARLSVEFAEKHGRMPNRQDLIEAYYGLALPDLSIYLGFAQPALFDVPLLTTGQEDLYATLTPSADLTERQLREILYDHLVTRRNAKDDYDALSDEALAALAEYNERYRGVTLGIGRIDPLTNVWNPILPDYSNYSVGDQNGNRQLPSQADPII